MAAYEVATDIQAPAERVWAVLSAVEAWPQWLPTVSSVEPLRETPLQVGRRYRVTQPRLRPTVWTVSVVEPERRFEWRARSPGMELVADHDIESTGPNAARVRLRFEFKGFVGVLLGAVFGGLTRNYLSQEAQALKCRAE
jgi:ribosome-associated toxin RatA of RatAB toxin-antitoxin module